MSRWLVFYRELLMSEDPRNSQAQVFLAECTHFLYRLTFHQIFFFCGTKSSINRFAHCCHLPYTTLPSRFFKGSFTCHIANGPKKLAKSKKLIFRNLCNNFKTDIIIAFCIFFSSVILLKCLQINRTAFISFLL